MGRECRIEYPGAIYHVYHRGNNREAILARDQDKWYFLTLLEQAVDKFGLEVFAYVVMRNHYHLGIRVGKISLSSIMHRINSKFGRHYNQEFSRSGHVFEGRYKAIPIMDDAYFLTVIRYIHQNPVRAGICDRVGEYRWSSDAQYQGKRGGFVNTDFLLSILGSNRQMALQEYANLMSEQIELDPQEISRPDTRSSGQPGSIDRGVERQVEKEPSNGSGSKLTLDEILGAIVPSTHDYEEIKRGSRRRYLIPFKRAFAQQAITYGYSLTEIAKTINISTSAIVQLIGAGY